MHIIHIYLICKDNVQPTNTREGWSTVLVTALGSGEKLFLRSHTNNTNTAVQYQ